MCVCVCFNLVHTFRVHQCTHTGRQACMSRTLSLPLFLFLFLALFLSFSAAATDHNTPPTFKIDICLSRGTAPAGCDGGPCLSCAAGKYRTGATHYNLARACGADGLQPCSTQQSSSMPEDITSGLHLADAAIDGNYAVVWGSDSCFRTDSNAGETYPWWMVDLGQVRSVRAVKIWNRGEDCCSWRLQGYEIWIGNSASSYSDNMRCHTGGTAPLSDPFTVTSACVDTGRYLFIGVPDLSIALNLCEVEVYEGCTDCVAGTYSAAEGATTCEACPAGKYKDTAGSAECSSCPAGEQSKPVQRTGRCAVRSGKAPRQTDAHAFSLADVSHPPASALGTAWEGAGMESSSPQTQHTDEPYFRRGRELARCDCEVDNDALIAGRQLLGRGGGYLLPSLSRSCHN